MRVTDAATPKGILRISHIGFAVFWRYHFQLVTNCNQLGPFLFQTERILLPSNTNIIIPENFPARGVFLSDVLWYNISMKNEELASKKRAIELYDSGKINEFEVGTTRGLQQIHQFLFQDVFDFAGKIREVNLAKGNFRFAPIIYLSDTLKTIDSLPENNYDEIIKKYVEMNIAHPFREGNGRATRIWLDQMLKKHLGKCVDWSKIGKEDYLSAMERSPINDLEIKTLLASALTSNINDREVYMKGIQSSYEYEEQDEYDIHKLQ